MWAKHSYTFLKKGRKIRKTKQEKLNSLFSKWIYFRCLCACVSVFRCLCACVFISVVCVPVGTRGSADVPMACMKGRRQLVHVSTSLDRRVPVNAEVLPGQALGARCYPGGRVCKEQKRQNPNNPGSRRWRKNNLNGNIIFCGNL